MFLCYIHFAHGGHALGTESHRKIMEIQKIPLAHTSQFQKVDFGSIDQAGYSMSKHGNVVLTRMYPHFKPAPSDDGVKAYALCPFCRVSLKSNIPWVELRHCCRHPDEDGP